jgi:hypothetical protein
MIRKLLSLSIRHLLFSLVLPRNMRKNIKKTPGVSNVVGELERTVGVEKTLRRYLLYFLLPLWMGAGLLDWFYHRRTKIEKTAGTHESMIHALMMSEAGFPLMVGLFLDVNALVLALMIVAFFLHEATAYWDVAYAEGLRNVTPNEQHVHSFLEVIPFMAVSFMICLHWDQFRALVGVGDEPARFELRPKHHPLSRRYTSGLLATVAATVALPYAEEFLRCYRVDGTLKAHPGK